MWYVSRESRLEVDAWGNLKLDETKPDGFLVIVCGVQYSEAVIGLDCTLWEAADPLGGL